MVKRVMFALLVFQYFLSISCDMDLGEELGTGQFNSVYYTNTNARSGSSPIDGQQYQIGDTITVLGNPFSGTLSLSANVTIIKSSVFSGCKFLDLLTIPEGITDIYNSAFSITTISTLSLPSTLTYLSSYAFAYSPNLNHVHSIANLAASIQSNSFINCDPVLKLTFPSGTEYSSRASNFPGGITCF